MCALFASGVAAKVCQGVAVSSEKEKHRNRTAHALTEPARSVINNCAPCTSAHPVYMNTAGTMLRFANSYAEGDQACQSGSLSMHLPGCAVSEPRMRVLGCSWQMSRNGSVA